MKRQRFRYSFGPNIPGPELEGTLTLALIAAEGLHGEAQLRLDASHLLAADRSACVIEVRGQAGHDLNKLFVNFLSREFGRDSYGVERIPESRAKVVTAGRRR